MFLFALAVRALSCCGRRAEERTGRLVSLAELNNGLDGVELDEVHVVHAECSWADVAPLLPGTPVLETMSA